MNWEKEDFIKHYFMDTFDVEEKETVFESLDRTALVDYFLRTNRCAL
ncbi:hypothetical protein ABMA71_00605 [Halobacteriovorax sp. ZH3_bin.1]